MTQSWEFILFVFATKPTSRCRISDTECYKCIFQSDTLYFPRLFFANMNSIYKLKLKLNLRDSPPVPEPIINRPERVNINSLDVWGRDWIIWTENYNSSVTDYKLKRDRLVAREKIVQKNGDEEPPVQIIREDIRKDTFGIKVSPKRDSGCSNHLAANPCSENQCSHMCLQSQVIS